MTGVVAHDNIFIAFDLDDTLYKEIDFVKSAFAYISKYLYGKYAIDPEYIYDILYSAFSKKENPFDNLFNVLQQAGKKISEPVSDLVEIYRNHPPSIKPDNMTLEVISRLNSEGYILGLITDGRSLTQRNKINALGLNHIFKEHNIIISEEFGSEKTNISNFKYFNDRYPLIENMYYIGDNPKKDFMNPIKLGWKTICLKDDGRNIHPQNFTVNTSPCYIIEDLGEIYTIIQ